MEAILDRTGATVAWMRHEDVVALDGEHLGFIEYDGFYSIDGLLLGHYFLGLFVDGSGRAVAFTPGTTVGPMKPLALQPPAMPSAAPRPRHPRVSLAPRMPMLANAWSGQCWIDYVCPHPAGERVA